MPEAATDQKSPKTPRRLKTGGEPPRQVHFATVEDADEQGSSSVNGIARSRSQPASLNQTASINSGADKTSAGASNSNSNSNSTTTTNNNGINEAINTQPTSFPQVGLPPGHIAAAGTQWHTAADPSRTLPLPGQPQTFAGCFASGLPQQPHHNVGFFASPQLHGGPVTYISHPSPLPHPAATSSPITYIGVNPQHPLQPHQHVGNMGDYQNTVPPPTGLNFQPPVPDTTFGPMQHVYVPRFDGGFVPGVHQPAVGGVGANQPGYVVAQQPAVIQQQPVLAQQPIMIGGQPFVAQGPPQVQAVPAVGMPGGLAMGPGAGVPIIAGNASHIPDISGIGRTTGEESLRQIKFAHANKLFEPQEFKPADDDPSRFYYVREVDGNWTQRNRFTIDRMGDCRWYVTDEGWFYAVRLPD